MNATATPARFAAVRAEGRYRVQDAATGEYVAVLASKAKAEERAAKMNAAEERAGTTLQERSEAVYAEDQPAIVASRSASLLDENGHLPEFAEPLTEEEAEEVAVALLGPARGAEAVAPAAPRPADKLVTVWVGWTVVDLIVPRVGDADPAVAAVARKLQERKPDGAKARTIRVNVAEREALAALATEIETDAVTAGSGALARSARALRGRLAV